LCVGRRASLLVKTLNVSLFPHTEIPVFSPALAVDHFPSGHAQHLLGNGAGRGEGGEGRSIALFPQDLPRGNRVERNGLRDREREMPSRMGFLHLRPCGSFRGILGYLRLGLTATGRSRCALWA